MMGWFGFNKEIERDLPKVPLADVKVNRSVTLRTVVFNDDDVSVYQSIRFFLIMVGLLQPDDKRSGMVDVVMVLFDNPDGLRALELVELVGRYRRRLGFDSVGVSGSNVRGHLVRLKRAGLLVAVGGFRYRLVCLSFEQMFDDKIVSSGVVPVVEGVKRDLRRLDAMLKGGE